jgi:hypothetical protein
VFRHLISLQSDSGFPVRADSIVGSDATGIRKLDRRRPGNSSQPFSNSDEFSSSGRSRGGEHRKEARMTEHLIARLDELARKRQEQLLDRIPKGAAPTPTVGRADTTNTND